MGEIHFHFRPFFAILLLTFFFIHTVVAKTDSFRLIFPSFPQNPTGRVSQNDDDIEGSFLAGPIWANIAA